MPDKDELERLLDSALATYADPGPGSGLEQRVLASLAAAREPRQRHRRLWWPWAIALPVAAALLAWIAMSRTPSVPLRETEQAQRPSINAPVTVPPPAASEKKHPLPITARNHMVPQETHLKVIPENGPEQNDSASTAPLPKLDVFPTPQPLTPQERALATVATQAPVPLRQALAVVQIQDDAPVRIAAIHIPPIEPPTESQR